ncbi:MAG: hypothetical protein Q8Q09_01020 [Deltaproteobacteria bacterium]|nr:hypothetical protein [Deltaproteobacteria bacterium]
MSVRERASGAVRFFKRGFEDFDTTASFVPSSRWLVEAMIAHVPLGAECVVEFGSGTGTLTREILARMSPHGKLYAVELDSSLLEGSVRSVNDPRMIPIFGSAVDTAQLVPPEVVGNAQAVVSSLGLSLMPEEIRVGIMQAARDLLAPGAYFTQYAYLHARWFAYSPARKQWFRWNAMPFMRAHWPRLAHTMVWPNVPPALVFSARNA